MQTEDEVVVRVRCSDRLLDIIKGRQELTGSALLRRARAFAGAFSCPAFLAEVSIVAAEIVYRLFTTDSSRLAHATGFLRHDTRRSHGLGADSGLKRCIDWVTSDSTAEGSPARSGRPKIFQRLVLGITIWLHLPIIRERITLKLRCLLDS